VSAGPRHRFWPSGLAGTSGPAGAEPARARRSGFTAASLRRAVLSTSSRRAAGPARDRRGPTSTGGPGLAVAISAPPADEALASLRPAYQRSAAAALGRPHGLAGPAAFEGRDRHGGGRPSRTSSTRAAARPGVRRGLSPGAGRALSPTETGCPTLRRPDCPRLAPSARRLRATHRQPRAPAPRPACACATQVRAELRAALNGSPAPPGLTALRVRANSRPLRRRFSRGQAASVQSPCSRRPGGVLVEHLVEVAATSGDCTATDGQPSPPAAVR